MNKNNQEKIISYLINCSLNKKILFEEFISEKCSDLIRVSPNLTIDIIYDALIDIKSEEKDIIIKQLKNRLTKIPHKKNFEIILEPPYYYIIPTIYSQHILSGVRQTYENKLLSISKLQKNKKGKFFENFCTYFLNDMGLVAEKTKGSGDKGIDILAYYSINLPNKLSNFFLNERIYLLAQAKFFSNPVDTPTIRKLVGDSLFIRFDRLEYLPIAHNAVHLAVFSHNGFTKKAQEFALKNKVLLFTSEDIIAFVCNEEIPEKLECIKYLLNFSC